MIIWIAAVKFPNVYTLEPAILSALIGLFDWIKNADMVEFDYIAQFDRVWQNNTPGLR